MKLFIFRNNPNETIDEVRMQLLQRILIVLNVLGIPVVIMGAVEAIVLKQYYTAFSYFIFYTPIIVVSIFRKKIAFKYSALIIIGFAFLLAISNIVIYGFGGAGIPVFFTIIVVACIFFDIKAGLYTVLICALAMSVIAYLYVNNIISLGVSLDEISNNIVSWITAIVVVAFLGSLIVISYGIIQKKMFQSISFSKLQAEELKNVNSQLKKDVIKRQQIEMELRNTQDNLEKDVQKRTEEIRMKNDELLKRNNELENYNNLFVDREYRIKELKEKIKQLENE